MSLRGKVALVTGASRGIGLSTAKRFCAEGASVMLMGRTLSDLKRNCEQLKSTGATCAFFAGDVSSESSVEEAFRETMEKLGAVDIVVNNAGAIASGLIQDLAPSLWDEIVGVNLRGTFLCSQQAFLQMKGRGGCIINLSSLGGIKGTEKFPGFSAYVAAKSGIVGLTEALAVEGKALGIRVNCVAPGAVNTAMLKKAAPQLKSQTGPDEVAEVILFLADPARSSTLNGSVIEIHSNL